MFIGDKQTPSNLSMMRFAFLEKKKNNRNLECAYLALSKSKSQAKPSERGEGGGGLDTNKSPHLSNVFRKKEHDYNTAQKKIKTTAQKNPPPVLNAPFSNPSTNGEKKRRMLCYKVVRKGIRKGYHIICNYSQTRYERTLAFHPGTVHDVVCMM